MKPLNVLIACEESGVVRDAFNKLGHSAVSCDLQPSSSPMTAMHYQGDVADMLYFDWDLIIGHPPCTYLCNSGVSWLHKDKGRWDRLLLGASFFRALLEVRDIPYVALENPIPHKYAVALIGRKYDQLIQPYHFGHLESKATCLWLKDLPPLQHTDDVRDRWKKLPKKDREKMHYLPPSKDRAKLRSKTYQGIADAMAKQWSEFIIKERNTK